MNVRASAVFALTLAALLACPLPGAGAVAGDSPGVVVCEGEGFRLIRPRSGGWYSREFHDRRLEKLRRRVAAAGMPEQALATALPEVEKRTMGLERHMLDSLHSYAYAQLGLVFGAAKAVDLAPGALTVKLRGAGGDSLVVVDAGVLAPTGPQLNYRYVDTRNGAGRLAPELQPNDNDGAPLVMFVRLPRECDGLSIESITVDPRLFVARTE